MSKRHQHGYIFEESGAFYLRYRIGKQQLCHRLCTKDRNTGCGSKAAKAVQQLREDFMRGINNEKTTDGKNLAIVEFWEQKFLPFITANRKPSTLQVYQQTYQKHLQDHFGKTLLKDYTTPMMSVYLTELAKTLRPRTMNSIKWLASAIFDFAVNTGACITNPIRDARWLGKDLGNLDQQVYSLEEIENIISALVDHPDCQLIMALAFFAGLRKGEIEALQWGDVDENFIHIRRARSRGVVGEPKTKSSIRSVPIIEPVKTLLVIWKQKSGDGVWVFNRTLQTASFTIMPILAKNKLPWRGFHAGRRGLGTQLRKLTGNSTAGQNLLGHTTPDVTEQHYEGKLPEIALQGMKLLEAEVKVTK